MEKEYRVMFEINISANSPLVAVEKVEEMIKEETNGWQWYVQDEETKQIYSVDTTDEDFPVMEVGEYVPLIQK